MDRAVIRRRDHLDARRRRSAAFAADAHDAMDVRMASSARGARRRPSRGAVVVSLSHGGRGEQPCSSGLGRRGREPRAPACSPVTRAFRSTRATSRCRTRATRSRGRVAQRPLARVARLLAEPARWVPTLPGLDDVVAPCRRGIARARSSPRSAKPARAARRRATRNCWTRRSPRTTRIGETTRRWSRGLSRERLSTRVRRRRSTAHRDDGPRPRRDDRVGYARTNCAARAPGRRGGSSR